MVIIMTSLSRHFAKPLILLITFWITAFPSVSLASFVKMQTDLGDIDIELFDDVTPDTVANFLNYVQRGDYDGTIIHRSVPGFIVQGGGFGFTDRVTTVTTDAPVVNEFNRSNLRGTIAMAKLGGDPDSATSQWFFNLGDNSANLDNQNGGFTVFGQVVGNGMQVVDAIATLNIADLSGEHPAWTSVPLEGYTPGDTATPSQLVRVNSVAITPVPVPATLWLLGSGLIGLRTLARRRQR